MFYRSRSSYDNGWISCFKLYDGYYTLCLPESEQITIASTLLKVLVLIPSIIFALLWFGIIWIWKHSKCAFLRKTVHIILMIIISGSFVLYEIRVLQYVEDGKLLHKTLIDHQPSPILNLDYEYHVIYVESILLLIVIWSLMVITKQISTCCCCCCCCGCCKCNKNYDKCINFCCNRKWIIIISFSMSILFMIWTTIWIIIWYEYNNDEEWSYFIIFVVWTQFL